MRVGSLFAGIGGFDLAARWMGWETAWVSEIDPYASAVLKKHFPNAPNLGDITTITQPPPVDILCGGFPCQDISLAGKGAGIGGTRSGLWKHYARIIEEIRPKHVLAENVSALRSRGLDVVLGDLAALGYDAEWHCIPAAYVGAPHRRDRIWIVAYPKSDGRAQECADSRGCHEGGRSQGPVGGGPLLCGTDVPDANGERFAERPEPDGEPEGWLSTSLRSHALRLRGDVPDANRDDAQGFLFASDDAEHGCIQDARPAGLLRGAGAHSGWETEPNVGRVAHGVPKRVDRLKCLGNAIVPQVAHLFFQAIAEHHSQTTE